MSARLRNLLCLAVLLLPCVPGMAVKLETVDIGAVYNLHGFQANLDIPSTDGARLAVDEINRNGGVLGRRVKLTVVDGISRPNVIARKTAALLKSHPDMPALVGLSDTDMVLAAAPVAAAGQRLFLTSGATSPKLPGQVPDYLFLACFGDNVQAAAAAEVAWNELSARTVAVLYTADDTYTGLLQGYFRQRFSELGGTVSQVRAYAADRIDGIADGLDGVDLVFLATNSPEQSLAIIQALRSAGLDVPVVGGDSYDSEQLWQQHPEIGNVYFTTHAYLGADNPDPVVVAFRQAYQNAYGTSPDAFAALGYDTVHLLVTAIRRAGSIDPAAVREALAGIQDFSGVTGAMHYPAGSRIPVKSVSVLQIQQGNVTLLRQLIPEQVPAP